VLPESAKTFDLGDLEEVISMHESESDPYRLNGCSWAQVAYEQNVSPLSN